jgi:hypothetical protein
MDDAFTYRTTAPVRREIDPRLVAAAIVLVIVLTGVGLFAHWVVASERRSLAVRPAAAPVVSAAPAPAPATPVGTMRDVHEALRGALLAARAAYADRHSFLDADPARLSELQPGFTFVDGPSTTASIVSIASTDARWAAAVLGPDGTCRWVGIDAHDVVVQGTSAGCTGAAALASLQER